MYDSFGNLQLLNILTLLSLIIILLNLYFVLITDKENQCIWNSTETVMVIVE